MMVIGAPLTILADMFDPGNGMVSKAMASIILIEIIPERHRRKPGIIYYKMSHFPSIGNTNSLLAASHFLT
jgi:hypothetical protein